jgi:hypothetical protein
MNESEVLRTIHKQRDWDYYQITITLADSCHEFDSFLVIIFCDVLLSNRDCADGTKQVRLAPAILYHE